MIESPVLQRMRAETLHGVILAVLKHRFGTVPRDVSKQLREVLNEKKLIALTVLAGKCADLQAFREALVVSANRHQRGRGRSL